MAWRQRCADRRNRRGYFRLRSAAATTASPISTASKAIGSICGGGFSSIQSLLTSGTFNHSNGTVRRRRQQHDYSTFGWRRHACPAGIDGIANPLQASDFIFVGQVAVTVQTPDGYDFSTLYDDLAASNAVTAGERRYAHFRGQYGERNHVRADRHRVTHAGRRHGHRDQHPQYDRPGPDHPGSCSGQYQRLEYRRRSALFAAIAAYRDDHAHTAEPV